MKQLISMTGLLGLVLCGTIDHTISCPGVTTPPQKASCANDVFSGVLVNIRTELTLLDWLEAKIQIALEPGQVYQSHLWITVLTFRVSENFKGECTGVVDVRTTSEVLPQSYMKLQERYVVYAHRDDAGRLWADVPTEIDYIHPALDPREDLRSSFLEMVDGDTPHN
jgi:hypothetical protein